MKRRSVAWLCALALVGCAELRGGARNPDGTTRPKRGALVSEHPLATAVGLDILEEGGNAADAAVATALALAVVYPQAGNLGGGGFALWVPADGGEALALDFRETAPRALTLDAYLEDGVLVPELSREGHRAVGVPGSPRGLHDFHRRFGKLPFARLASPAVRLARDGFDVDPWLAHHLRDPHLRERLMRSPSARRLFYPAGRPLAAGDRLVQTALAETLDRLVRNGPAGFYDGVVARAIVHEMESAGGLVTLFDLASYSTVWRTPLRGWFRGYEIVSMPPPSSGGIILLQVLRILDGFPLDAERAQTIAERRARGIDDPVGLDARTVHWWIEALRRSFADRAEHLGDPYFHDVPVAELLSPEWITARRTSIGARADPHVGPWSPTPAPLGAGPERGETTHVSVLDEDGNAVSLTTTLNGLFGSGVMVGELGLLLNNEMDDFALAPGIPNEFGLVGSSANAIEPGKRPLSSMTPAVLRQGGRGVTMVIGSPGGPRIPTAVLQVVLRTLVHGQDLADAVRAPRLHQQWSPTSTEFEAGWDPALLAELRELGHETRAMPKSPSSVQAILLRPDGEPVAVSDPRRGGVAGIAGKPLGQPALPPEPAVAPMSSSAP